MHRFQRWREILQGTATPGEVRRVMSEYVDVIGPSVISTLPPACQDALRDDDIQGAAVTLLQCELSFQGEQKVAELLHEIAHTFAAAATRLSRLNREPTVPSAE